MWQDTVITITVIVFSLALLPQIWHGYKNKVGTIEHKASVPTFICLYVLTYVYYTLDLLFSSVMVTVTGTLWLILFLQKLKYSKKDNVEAPQK